MAYRLEENKTGFQHPSLMIFVTSLQMIYYEAFKLQTTPNQMNRDLERTFAIDTTIYIVKCKPTLLDASGHPGTDMA
ncbi:uncharacterized protein OCT59_008460 [Rhizophagus irregularis]|uniref:uncharacterized protein n=1 Tax=Rhizophagus irregularis TaxID=588596 RepID=UPI0019F30DAC|nr:hypothetical protein OCT59_008460 [Rhizophagus irregularis]GET60642.1 hypothetical protein RIR_jg2283.t1 [Rhizophagus irregularis DAOM 181602=DAOM 197198]